MNGLVLFIKKLKDIEKIVIILLILITFFTFSPTRAVSNDSNNPKSQNGQNVIEFGQLLTLFDDNAREGEIKIELNETIKVGRVTILFSTHCLIDPAEENNFTVLLFGLNSTLVNRTFINLSKIGLCNHTEDLNMDLRGNITVEVKCSLSNALRQLGIGQRNMIPSILCQLYFTNETQYLGLNGDSSPDTVSTPDYSSYIYLTIIGFISVSSFTGIYFQRKRRKQKLIEEIFFSNESKTLEEQQALIIGALLELSENFSSINLEELVVQVKIRDIKTEEILKDLIKNKQFIGEYDYDTKKIEFQYSGRKIDRIIYEQDRKHKKKGKKKR